MNRVFIYERAKRFGATDVEADYICDLLMSEFNYDRDMNILLNKLYLNREHVEKLLLCVCFKDEYLDEVLA